MHRQHAQPRDQHAAGDGLSERPAVPYPAPWGELHQIGATCFPLRADGYVPLKRNQPLY